MANRVDPIDDVQWLFASSLNANDYNPNVVYNTELRLLEYNIVKHGWIQPVLVSPQMVIIDGFHRWKLSVDSTEIKKRYGGKLPCVVLDLSEPECMLLTIRINRAKGQHAALRMSAIVQRLINNEGMAPEYIARGIGATMEEVNLLLADGVFKAKSIANYRYGKAWVPRIPK